MIHDLNANITRYCIFRKGRLSKRRVDRRNIVYIQHSTSVLFRITGKAKL